MFTWNESEERSTGGVACKGRTFMVMFPRLPLALLAIVLALYALDAIVDLRTRRDCELAVEGPVIDLRDGSSGAWSVHWPEWPRRKGAPILCAEGRMYGADGTPPPARVFLRVTPRECVRFSEGAPVEAEGWFRAAGIYDGAVQANLELGRPCTIEYELRPGDSSTPARLALRVGPRTVPVGSGSGARQRHRIYLNAHLDSGVEQAETPLLYSIGHV